MIAAADVNVADEFEIGEEEMAIFLNQAFDEGVLNQEGFLILLHAKDNKNWPNFPFWNYARFGLELLDD